MAPIRGVGEWVLRTACNEAARWSKRFPGLEDAILSVNVSPQEFSPGLLDHVRDALSQSGLEPSKLRLEITETALVQDVEKTMELMLRLKVMGVRLSIDDFGTGYSNLWRLKNLPVDVLKIDRSFVSRVDTDPQAAKIVAAFIQLGQGLGMTTLAEGIETEGEWRFLAEQGCELGQGFYFSRPVPAGVLTERFRSGDLVAVSA